MCQNQASAPYRMFTIMTNPERLLSLEKKIPEVSRLSFTDIAAQAAQTRGILTLPALSSYSLNFRYEDSLAERTVSRFLSVGVVTLEEPLRVKTGGIGGSRDSSREYDLWFIPKSPKEFLRAHKGLCKRYGIDPSNIQLIRLNANLDRLPATADEADVLFPK